MGIEKNIISEVRQLTDTECKEIGLPVDARGNPYCLVLDTGSILFPVSDHAMNSGGGWIEHEGSLQDIEGEYIETVTPMSEDYAKHLNWNVTGERSLVIKFSNGCILFTSQDPEGNGPGLLFQYEDNTVYEIEVVQK